jgi:hypothetical protein
MKSFVAAAFLGVAFAGDIDVKFMEHILTHSLSYGTVEEYQFRRARFEETDAYI